MPAFLLPLIMAGASAAANLFGAKKSSDAAKKAAEQQATSAQQALAIQAQMYQQSRADLSPYREQGGQGLTALTALLDYRRCHRGRRRPRSRRCQPRRACRAGATYTGHYAVPRAPCPTAGASAHAPSGPWCRSAPTGQTKLVPASEVDYYLGAAPREAKPWRAW